MHVSALRVKKKATDSLQLELQAAASCPAWELETQLGIPLEEQYTVLSPEPCPCSPFLESRAVHDGTDLYVSAPR